METTVLIGALSFVATAVAVTVTIVTVSVGFGRKCGKLEATVQAGATNLNTVKQDLTANLTTLKQDMVLAFDQLRNNDFEHIHVKLTELCELRKETTNRCAVHAERITEVAARMDNLDGRLARLERQVNGEGP